MYDSLSRHPFALVDRTTYQPFVFKVTLSSASRNRAQNPCVFQPRAEHGCRSFRQTPGCARPISANGGTHENILHLASLFR